MSDADVIIIGSGFGGSVTACRLAQAGAKVLVLERGREWSPSNFPRAPTDPWIFDANDPLARHGWFDMRIWPNMTVATGAGVGGGSLVYANISVEAKPDSFDAGWPAGITYDTLAPYYAEVGRMMEVQRVPRGQWPERTKLLNEAATKAGWQSRFRPLELAVRFDPAYTYDQADPHDHAKSKIGPNIHGVEQGTCVHLGECDIGCPVKARNTLDFNYLAVARKLGVTVLPLHMVRDIRAASGGFQVIADEITATALQPKTFTSPRVIVAAGSIGSTELMLKARASGGLGNVSPRLGMGWSSNGDFLTPAIHPLRNVDPTHGPTITAAIDLLDRVFMGQPVFIEDGGFPNLTADAIKRAAATASGDDLTARVTKTLLPAMQTIDLLRSVMPWFAQSRDAANGVFSLKKGRLFLDWDITASEATIDAVVKAHRKLASLTGGVALTPITWELGRDLVTPHPLGGCNMGTSADNGVVDSNGQVFGHPGLYIADGAIIPKALGLNPSRTIAALAEHIAAGLVASPPATPTGRVISRPVMSKPAKATPPARKPKAAKARPAGRRRPRAK